MVVRNERFGIQLPAKAAGQLNLKDQQLPVFSYHHTYFPSSSFIPTSMPILLPVPLLHPHSSCLCPSIFSISLHPWHVVNPCWFFGILCPQSEIGGAEGLSIWGWRFPALVCLFMVSPGSCHKALRLVTRWFKVKTGSFLLFSRSSIFNFLYFSS